MATRHILDSLTAVPVLVERHVDGGRIDAFLDLGSGGGYPGIPLAAVLETSRAKLVDSIGKKAAFLTTTVAATGLAGRVSVVNQRAEQLGRDPRHRERWPAVTARAVGELDQLVELAFPLLCRDGILVAWKRGDIDDEIGAARRAIGALGGGRLETLPVAVSGLAGHCLVVITKRGPTPEVFPRDPSTRRRRPC